MTSQAITTAGETTMAQNGTLRVKVPVMLVWLCALGGLGAYLVPYLQQLVP
jgi:hypothetical protein